jgi:tetratricopeptide (TPR) repeat protein
MVMDWKFKRLTLLLVGFLVIGFTATINAQDLNEAKRAIKKGDQEKRSENYEEAISAFEKCIRITNQLASEEAGVTELKLAAQKKVVKSHLDYANDLFKQETYDQAMTHYKKAVELADKYGQQEYGRKARNNVPKVHYEQARNHMEKKEYEKALRLFDKAIEGDPDYGWAYIRRAMIYRDMGREDSLEHAVQEAMEIGQGEDNDVAQKAKKVAYRYFYNKGAKAFKAKDYEQAITNLEKSTKYGGSATLQHYIALSYRNLSQFEEAASHEKKVVEALEEQGKSGKELAKYYYYLGQFYEKAGNNSAACDAYKKAAYGQYKEYANWFVNNKCD